MNYLVLDDNVDPEIVAQMRLNFNHNFMADFLSVGRTMIRERMHESYATYMIEHSKRVAEFYERLLIATGMDEDLAFLRRQEMEGHDIGKMHKSQVGRWILTTEKQLKSAFDKGKDREHAALGPSVTDEVIQIMGIPERSLLRSEERMRLRLSDYLQTGHHDTYKPEMGVVLQAAVVADSIDGQLKTLTETPLHELDASTLQALRGQAIEKLMGEKYKGQLSPDVLNIARVVNDMPKHRIREQSLESLIIS